MRTVPTRCPFTLIGKESGAARSRHWGHPEEGPTAPASRERPAPVGVPDAITGDHSASVHLPSAM